jgi:hypothetical protein
MAIKLPSFSCSLFAELLLSRIIGDYGLAKAFRDYEQGKLPEEKSKSCSLHIFAVFEP